MSSNDNDEEVAADTKTTKGPRIFRGERFSDPPKIVVDQDNNNDPAISAGGDDNKGAEARDDDAMELDNNDGDRSSEEGVTAAAVTAAAMASASSSGNNDGGEGEGPLPHSDSGETVVPAMDNIDAAVQSSKDDGAMAGGETKMSVVDGSSGILKGAESSISQSTGNDDAEKGTAPTDGTTTVEEGTTDGAATEGAVPAEVQPGDDTKPSDPTKPQQAQQQKAPYPLAQAGAYHHPHPHYNPYHHHRIHPAYNHPHSAAHYNQASGQASTAGAAAAGSWQEWNAAAHRAAQQYAGYYGYHVQGGKPPQGQQGAAATTAAQQVTASATQEASGADLNGDKMEEDTTKEASGEEGDGKDQDKQQQDQSKSSEAKETGDDKNKEGGADSETADNTTVKPTVTASSSWNSHGHQVPHPHPHAAYYQQWHHAHAAAVRAGYHHYNQQQQQKHGAQSQQQGGQQQQHPHQYPYHTYWYHQAAASQGTAAHKHQQAHPGIAWSNSNTSGNTNAATAGDSSNTTTSTVSMADATAGGGRRGKNKKQGKSSSSTASNATDGSKKRQRDYSNPMVVESRDDTETRDYDRAMMSMNDDASSTTGTMSLSGFSLGSLGLSSKRHKSQSIHRTNSQGQSYDDDDESNLKLLGVSSTLSEGKMILKNLSINSSYSADFTDICGSSPLNQLVAAAEETLARDEGKTPKKCNTSRKNKDKAPLVFRLETGHTPAASRSNDGIKDDSSPTMFDLIGGAETPTANMLLENSSLTDDLRSLNGHLRGQSFTPLPVMMSENVVSDMPMPGGMLSCDPQLSWSSNGSPPLEITPRCFGVLDSTKSAVSTGKLGSPKSFWKDNMLEDDIDGDNRSTSPLPLYYPSDSANHKPGQENSTNVKTPLRRPPVPSGFQTSFVPSPFAPSPIPHGSHPHHAAAAAAAGYHHQYPGHQYYHYNPNDRVRNLRGNGPPRHQMPPQHHLPPPSYHHFSPLTNVIAAPPHKMGRNNQYRMPHQLEIVCGSSSSKRKCIPLKPPIPSKFQGDVDKFKDAPIPEFNNLVNFPGHMSNKPSPNVPEGMRCCVMCGQACPCSMGGKKKKDSNSNNSAAAGEGPAPLGDSTGTNTNKSSATASSSNNYATIPTQNKGLCTICDVNVWIVTASGLEIKWCKGCKNYRPWAAFGDKGLATKCVRCRERQREKYALQKEEKEKLKAKQHQMKKDRDKQQQQVVF